MKLISFLIILNLLHNSEAKPIIEFFQDEAFEPNPRETLLHEVTNATNVIVLPIEPNSDVIILETDTEANSPDPGGGSHTRIEDIIKSETSREDSLASKKKDTESRILEIDIENASVRKQLNSSSPIIEDVMDAEQGRDESLTNFMGNVFPNFQFLKHTIKNDSENGNIIFDVKAANADDVLRTVADYAELVEIVSPTKSVAANKSAYKTFANATGYYVEKDTADSSFDDIQTLILACLATLLPLLMLLVGAFLVRCFYLKWCRRCRKKSDESSSCPSQDPSTDDSIKETLQGAEDDSQSVHQELNNIKIVGNGSNMPRNGSIITMTLKNNHLIVETEETNNICHDGTETRMKYTNDGIFVVKVQQPTPYRGILKSSVPTYQSPTNQEALVHREQVTESPRQGLPPKTGLSISDLSLSSEERINPSYAYSNQTAYDAGPFGYDSVVESESINSFPSRDNSKEPLILKTPLDLDKPIVTAAIFKQDSLIGNEMLQKESYSIEGSSDGPLLSDVLAREQSLLILHEKDKNHDSGSSSSVNNIEETAQEEQSETNTLKEKPKLSRADSLPAKVSANDLSTNENVMITIVEEESEMKSQIKNRKSSLPILMPEIENSDSSTNVQDVICSNSHVSQDNSSVPLITVTEECDESKNNESDNKS